MSTSNISLDLSNKLPADRVNVIRRVVRTATGLGLTHIFIVGAQARDIILQHGYGLVVRRATNDTDFAVAVEKWDQFSELKEGLISSEGFRAHPDQRQRLVHSEGAIIDLVPFGDLEQTAGVIAWPPDFAIVMSTLGFREAYANSITVRVGDALVFKVASLAGLALLKTLAWADRRAKRDAQDLGLIMSRNPHAGNQERLYTPRGDCFDLLDDDFDYDRASARVLGRDLARWLADETRKVIERFVKEEAGENGPGALAIAMVKNGANYGGDFDLALIMISQLRKGLSECSN